MSERRLTALGRHRWPSLFGLVAASTALWLAGSASLKAADPPPAPEGWLETVQRQLEASEYEISWQTRTSLNGIPEAFQAPNRAQGFRTCFVPEGIWIIPRRPSEPSWKLGLRLPGADAANPPLPRVDGAVALFERPGLVLSVENSPRGLLFRWTLSAQEGHGQEARVPLLRRVDGLLPSLASDGRAIDFRAPGGGPAVLRLGELRAADAAGRSLSVRLVGTKGHDSRLFVAFGEAPAWPVTVEALATAASWTGEADQADANFGYGAGTAGDVNGDGYSDVIVGAPGYDNGQSGEGRAYVYYGSASGLATSPAWTAESDMANASFGRVVGTAGDVNGDGFSDVIIGASGYTNGESLEGAAFVYHGGPGGLSATPDWTVEGGQAGAQLGMSAGTAGDVNGDGYSDVLSGAYYYDDGETDEGVVFVFHGSPAGLSTGYAASLQANQAYARFGTSAGTAGDVNGDGYADVIVGADGYDGAFGDDGGAFVFLGSASGLLTPPALSATSGQASAGFGISVGTAGDVNGDGYADVVVGAPNYDLGQSNEGAAFVYLGGSSGPSASPAWTGQADQADARYGFSVSSAGDVNGDTYADLLIGSMYFTNGQFREGRLFVYLGGSGGPAATASWTAESDQNTACLGFPVATAGDVNGDGYADIIAGAMLYDNGQADEGRAYVFHGGPDGLGAASSWSTEGNQANAYWGTSLASAGDVNGDGFDDFLLGSNGFDTAGGANAGKVELFFGSAGGPDATPDWTLEGTQPDGWLGVSAAGAGDVNGDGYADVLIGEAGYSNGQTREGRALLFLGSPSGLGGSPDWAFESNLAYRTMGNPVASAGDVNGDGYADVLLGAPTLWDCHCPGRAYLFHGSPAGLAASPDWTAASDQAEAWFGNSVGSAGDVNGDGFSDVFVAEYAYNGDRGRVFVWYGSTSGLGDAGTPANFDWSAASDGESERFGWRAAGAGDVNGDGYSDLLVGAPNHSSGQIHEGRVCLFQGSASGLAATPSWAAESDQADAQFGYGLSGGGDWNGDGFSDFAAGALAFDGSAGANCGKAWAFYGSVTGPSTPSATTWEGIQAGEFFGLAASSAGDVDGDGRADLLICAQGYDNGESDEGRVAFFYGGGGGGGLALTPGQRRLDDSAPIGPLGLSDDRDGFRIAALGRSPFGRGNLRLQTEVKPFGAAFDGTGLQVSAWADSSLSGAALQNAITGLDDAGGYHWRARLLFDPVTLPYQGSGRWFSPPINGWPEMDLRLHAEADLRIASFTDSPDPVNNLQDLTYGLTIENDGPDEAEGAIVSLVLAPAGVSVAFVPGSSDARWAWDAGTMTLTADLGTLADGVSTSLDAVFTVSGTGSLEADASVSSSTTDPDSGNDSASATTTVSPIADLAITAFTDAPDPVPENTTLTYTLSLSNGGPDTSSATVTETFSPVGTTLTFLPGSSDPRWSWDAGTLTLTASVGAMASGATDSLSAAFTVGPPGTAAAHAEVSGSVFDPSAANNSADASTTICDPTPGAFTVLHPPDASASLSTSAAFYWTPSDGATSYDLRLGTTSPPPLHTSGLTATETSVEGLTPGATYYWDVEARTPCGAVLSSDGPRSFTTGCLTRVGRWPEKPYGMVRSSVVYGAYAYYGNGLYLTVLEVSDPAHPSVVRELPLPAPVDEGELLVAEGYLFAPLTNGTLTIYDLADPETPSEVSTLGGFAGLRGGMEFYGGLLYAADQTSGLRVVSLSPLTSPSIIGTLATSHARDLTLYEKAFTKYAYVVDAYDGLVVMNVTNPAVPVLLTAVDLGDWPESVARSGEYLYVADATNGMRVFSLANPALPVEVGSYVTPNYTEWVVLSGATAFLCDGPGGIKALDVTIPSAPALLGQIDTPGVAMHVWLDGSRAFVGDDFGGLRILDVSAPAAMGELGYRDDSEESTLSLHTNGSLAYVARYSEGLAVMDVSDPSAPVQLGLWSRPGGSLRSVTVSGNTAFVSERYGGLHLVDVSTSATPVLLGSYTDRFGFSCAVSGTLAYFCANTYGLVVLDVSDPADPHEVFRLDTPGGARMVALDAGRAYLADANGGLRILDLSDPVHP
ncbi:MAG: FG-GAP-like repeat-containing protein, partial [Acidobacteriota bacterium]